MSKAMESLEILYCEDEDEVREAIHILLIDFFPRARITVCKNGVEGIKALQNQTPFDLIVSDNNMPSVEGQRGDGKTLFKYYKEMGNKGPFVICSGCDKSEFSELLKESNFYYLPKIKLNLSAKEFFIEILNNFSNKREEREHLHG